MNSIIKSTSDRLAIILLTYFASQSVSDFEKLKENLTEIALICMAGEERGLDILKGILSILKEVIQKKHIPLVIASANFISSRTDLLS
ncbi:hypothetical protein [Ferroglobus placidus]|uniref:hypothetical protein n=1 Tax=Ferroglobus placidus TaxID=54261 RepID=UPI00064E9645|nr:hypothetical protein [Ferroglobus placidus]